MKKAKISLKEFLRKCKIQTICIFVCFAAIIGQLLNWKWEHKLFQFNLVLLLCMLLTQILVLKKIDVENQKIKECLSQKKELEVLGSFNTRVEKFLSPWANNSISISFIIIYIYSMFRVGCLEYTPTGCFGAILGAIVFYVGIQAYQQYLALLYFASDLKNLKIRNYFFYFPASTEWIDQLSFEFNYIEKWFLALGSMYSIIYAANLPPNAISFDNGISFHTPCNFLFIITWIGIIIFFALAVPVFTILSRYFIKNCIYACKRVSINKLEQQIAILSIQTSETDLNSINQKLSVIKEILNAENYPAKYSRSIFDNIYTVSFSIVTLICPLASIIEPFLFK